MEPTRPARRFFFWGLLVLLGCAVAAAPRFMLSAFAGHREQLASYDAQCAHIDEAFHAVAPRGNLLLQFAGWDDTQPGQRLLMLMFYFRGASQAYPRRLYVADSATVEPPPDGAPLFPPFQPTVEWLKAHDVQAKLTIQRSDDGSIRFVTSAP